jgi:hypothetical protein
MDREFVQSTNLRSVGYDAGDMILEIEFRSGGIYQYSNVPPEIYEALMLEPSKGRYFDRHIKERYRFRRVRRGW